MEAGLLGLLAAFGAGLVSFLSPCVLPLIPGYISFITGFTPTELAEEKPGLGLVLVPSLLFVAGFTLVFVSLGASASVLGSFLVPYRTVLARVAGVLIVLMGVFLLGIVKVPWLYGEKRFEMSRFKSVGRGASFVMGMAFAFGWTPCVGPILAGILTLAGSSADLQRGSMLLLAYSAGLGLPFLVTGMLFGRLRGALRYLNRHSLVVNRAAGVLLIVMGVLMLTGRLAALGAWMLRFLPAVG